MRKSGSVAPVDEILPFGQLATLGLQHVLVMYSGAIAVPLIIGRALQLTPTEVTMLIQADLLACGIVTIIQSLGVTRWFGIKLPVMMGVSFAPVGPMLHMAQEVPGHEGAQLLFGTILVAGLITIIIAPYASRLLRFFPPVVTGTIIAIIGIALMQVGIEWIVGQPFGPTAPHLVDPAYTQWLSHVSALAHVHGIPIPPVPTGLAISPTVPNPLYAYLPGMGVAFVVLVAIVLISRFFPGFWCNIAVLLGIILGAVITTALGWMHYGEVAKVPWLHVVRPFQFGLPKFSLPDIAVMVIVMVVIMIESTGMYLALSEMTGKPIGQQDLARGLRTDGLGSVIGAIFNTFPYSSFSQNVGLVAVTGVRSRFVCVMGGVIMVILSLLPKLAAVVEALPNAVLGGAGLVMFGMVTATGIRILGNVDFKTSRKNGLIVAIAIGAGMIPVIAPNWTQWMPMALHPLLGSGILLTSVFAVVLNLLFESYRPRPVTHAGAAPDTRES